MTELHTRRPRHVVARALLTLILGLALAGLVPAETIAVVGTGQVAGALGPEFADYGNC